MVLVLVVLVGKKEQALLLKMDVWSRLRHRVIIILLIYSGAYCAILGATIYWNFTFPSVLYGLHFPSECCHWTKLFGTVVCICHALRIFGAIVCVVGVMVFLLVSRYYTQNRQSVIDIEIGFQRQLILTVVPVSVVLLHLGVAYFCQIYTNLNIVVQNQILDRVQEIMDSSPHMVHFTGENNITADRLPRQDCMGFYHVLVNAGVYKSGLIHTFPDWEYWIQGCCFNIQRILQITDEEKTNHVIQEIQGCQYVLTFYIWSWMEKGYIIVTSYCYTSAFVLGKYSVCTWYIINIASANSTR